MYFPRLVSKLLCLVKKQFTTLKEHNILSQDIEQEYTSIVEDLEGGKRIMWADETTRESLDVASIINFTSCTPVRTPARTRNVLVSNTPQRMAGKDRADGVEDNYEFLTAKNSYFNSRKGVQGASEFSFVSGATFGSIELKSGQSDNNGLIESKDSGKTDNATFEESMINGPNGNPKRQFAAEPNLQSPSRRRLINFDADFENSAKVARFDPDMLPHVPASEPSITEEKKWLDNAELHAKDRRGTIVLQKGPEEVKSLPLIPSPVASRGNSGTNEARSEPATEAMSCDFVDTNKGTCIDNSEKQHVVEAEKMAAPSTLNATFDVISASKASIQLTSSDHDLSGFDPIPDTPDRKPLTLLCDNKLKGDSISSPAPALKVHGLPSMRSASNLKIGKSPTNPASKSGNDTWKQENSKLLNSASKSITGSFILYNRFASKHACVRVCILTVSPGWGAYMREV